MLNHHRVLLALLAFSACVGVAQADVIPRLRTSWKEKDARVAAFSPDGRSLVSSGGDGHQLRDAATGAVRSLLAGPRVGFDGPVFSPDGRTLYAEVGTDDFKPVGVSDLKAWDVETGHIKATFSYVHEAMGEGHCVLSADGSRLAFLDNSDRLPMQVKTSKFSTNFGTFDVAYNVNPGLPRVVIWDVARGERVARVDGGLPLAFSGDGKTLVTGDRDSRTPVAKVWEADTGRLRLVLQDRAPGIWPVVISPDGRHLASGMNEMTSLWDLSDGRRWTLDTKGMGGSAQGAMFSRDSRLLFPGGMPRIEPQMSQWKGPPVYDLATMPPVRLPLESGELAISPDGRRYAALIGERFQGGPLALSLRNLPSMRETGRREVNGLVGAGFSPDGRWLAILVGRHEAMPAGSGSRYVLETQLLDPLTARVLATIPSPGPTWGNYGWKFSPDAKSLAIDYRTGSNVSRAGDPDPIDRPMNLEIWDLFPLNP